MVIDEALIQRVAQTIAAQFQPRRIILFGSHARGDAGPDSDLDLFVEMETAHRLKSAVAIDMALGFRNFPMDIIVCTPEDVVRYTGQVGTLLYVAETEGRVLYECADYAPVIPNVADVGG